MQTARESSEAVRAYLEAEDIARRAGQDLSSVHLLLALFTFTNRAQTLLLDREVDEDRILKELRVLEDEPKRTVSRLRERAREIARGSGSADVDSLHILIAVTRLRDAFAYRLLERTGASLTSLRNIAVSYVTGNMPRRFRTLSAPAPAEVEPWVRTRTTQTTTETRPAPPTKRAVTSAPPAVTEPDDEFAAVAQAVEVAAELPTVTTAAPAVLPKRTPPVAPAKKLTLDNIAPTLAACGVDLTARGNSGELDSVFGRDREIEALVDILGKRRANNPMLVGPPGVGKTAIVEGLALKIARGDEDVAHFSDRLIVALDTGSLVAGTSLRGAFSERLGAIKAEVANAAGRIIVFIDEIHTLIGAGSSGEGPQDAANELKAVLARGDFPCIGATTHDEFKKYIEKDPALERRFTPVLVEEPTTDEAILILEAAAGAYAEHHGVDYSLDAIHAAVQLSHRFVTERQLPDKAFAALDLAGSRARRGGNTHVGRIDVARVIHEWSGVPLERLAEVDADRFTQAEQLIGHKLIGHPEVVATTCRALRRGLAGFNSRRPIASFLFLGPTGVGKTELVKVLAEFLFGRRDAVVRIDMSELVEQHSVARLIGAQPGYIGYEEGGQLTEAVRRKPFQIVLFDEIEKAHRDVLNLLLQILDEGQLTDGRGKRVSFANTLVVLTSNLGSDRVGSSARTIGFGKQGTDPQGDSAAVIEAARAALAPELWGRLDERLVFSPLDREAVRRIAELQLKESSATLFAEREVSLEWTPEVVDFLLMHGGFSPETGARGMRQAIQRHIEGPVAERLLAGDLHSGSVAFVDTDEQGALDISAVDPARRVGRSA